MSATDEDELVTNRTTIEQVSDREIVVRRTINGPVRLVYEAWATPELFRQWWVSKSLGLSLLSCELDVRTGGTHRLVFAVEGSEVAFYGRYLDVVPESRLTWTNEEGGDAGQVTTVTFDEQGGRTLVVVHELYPSKEALDEARESGAEAGTGWLETFDQLEAFVAGRAAV
ncbi:MAG: SRPBCC domain-containing protein [Dehalococcoidia bacterium]